MNIGGGEPICNATVTIVSTTGVIPSPTALGNGTSIDALRDELKTKKDTVTGLAVALGCIGLALAAFIFLWLKEKRRNTLPGPVRGQAIRLWAKTTNNGS